MSATLTPTVRAKSQRLLLRNVPWDRYAALGEALAEQPIRLTYDRGALEITTVSAAHDRYKTLIGILLFVIAEALNKEIRGFGAFTHQREDLSRGMEPDQCFYIANVPAVDGEVEIDLSVDPPPDLAVEIEISRSLLDRLAILAALGVPEVWRLDENRLRVLILKDGTYEASDKSLAFPETDLKAIVRLLKVGARSGEIVRAREARAWLAKSTRRGSKRRR